MSVSELKLPVARSSAFVAGLGPVAIVLFAFSNRDPFLYAAILFVGVMAVIISTCLGLFALISKLKAECKPLWLALIFNAFTLSVIAFGVPFI